MTAAPECGVPYDRRVSRSSPTHAPADADAPPTAVRLTRVLVLGAIAAAVVALDQVTKVSVRAWLEEGEHWPGGVELLRISHVENSGAAFGILEGAGELLLLSSVVAAVLVIAYLWFLPRDEPLYGIALTLVLGGTIGNLIDRATRGTVTDFIDPTHYPAFNIADSAIVVGVATLLLLSLFGDRLTRTRAGCDHVSAERS